MSMGWTVRASNPGGATFSARPDRPWDPPSLLHNGYRVFPRGKVQPGHAADHSSTSSGMVMEEYSYTSIHPLGHIRAYNGNTLLFFLLNNNTLRRHLYIMGMNNKPACKKCGNEEETSVHILCECEALASLKHTHLGSFFLDPEDIRKLSIGVIWNFTKGTGLL